MMKPEEMRSLVKQEPFRPFRVYLDDGRVFEVRHPSLTLITRRDFVIGIPAPEFPDLRAKESVLLDWSNIQRVEMLEPTPTPAP
jgi:hypothetical protein